MELADSPAAERLVRRKREDVLHCDEVGGDRRQRAESIVQKHPHQSQIKYDQCRYEDRLVTLMLRSCDASLSLWCVRVPS